MGIRSTNGVNDHLRALERKGYITRAGLHARAITTSDQPPAPREEPPWLQTYVQRLVERMRASARVT